MDNLQYYEQLRSVPKEALKDFSNGRFSGTDINPMWRIKKMTEMFGPCGIGWYVEVTNRHFEKSPDGVTICSFVSVNLYINVNGEWSKPIYGEGGNTFTTQLWDKKSNQYKLFTSDEAYKMAYTDAFSNATKQLGLGADVWFENDKIHSTKYDVATENNKANAAAKQPAPTPQPAAQTIDTKAIVMQFFNTNIKAAEYYLNKFNCGTLDEFNNRHWADIYNELKRNNKI